MIDDVLAAMQKTAAQARMNETVNTPEHDLKNDQVNNPVNELAIVESTLKLSSIYQSLNIVAESKIEYTDVCQCYSATITYGSISRFYPMIEVDNLGGCINCYNDPKADPVDVIKLWSVECSVSKSDE